MAKIKIISNPYERLIKYYSFNDTTGLWEDIRTTNPNSKLREDESEKSFLPFKIKEIIDSIIEEYYVGADKIELCFEGTRDEYDELLSASNDVSVADKITLVRSDNYLENARDILTSTKDCFCNVQPVIEKIVKDDESVIKDLAKVSDSLDDIIPICVFGNYSAGKSTFINALIGYEVLASGGTVVTAKIYRIENSAQEDRAKIRFTFRSSDVELSFEGTDFRVAEGENILVDDIKSTIESLSDKDLYINVKTALELINNYEKTIKDIASREIGNVVSLEIPFSKKGILGLSQNRFVIFDTPGSNSNTNFEHSRVLIEALDGFSNGIPIWVTTYDNLDSTDNAELCDKILSIPALDKRFTMIVCNRADQADLGEDGFSDDQVEEILEYDSVEDMYASGIYFVSSIMGLGSKNNGEMFDKFYRKTYRRQVEAYEDPEDEYYTSLYKFNIMPKQMKQKTIEYAAACENLVYANSGLLSVEMDMEAFASRYAAYNKCQMVYRFLNSAVDEANRRIEAKTDSLKHTREARKKELESAKMQLIEHISDTAVEMRAEFESEAEVFAGNIAADNEAYLYSADEIKEINKKVWDENADNTDIENHAEALRDSKSALLEHLKNNGQDLFNRNFLDSLKDMAAELKQDISEIHEQRSLVDNTEREIDKVTSDKVIEYVSREYKNNTLSAKATISVEIKEHWRANAESLRNTLIGIITETDALNSTQRDELQSIILNYETLKFDDDAENIFIKAKFLIGHIFGMTIVDCQKLNTRRLTDIYNDNIKNNIKEIAQIINENCIDSFKSWEEKLNSVIEQNITEYNPRLRDMSDMIREETERIAELEEDQKKIIHSLEAIKSMMSWKTTN